MYRIIFFDFQSNRSKKYISGVLKQKMPFKSFQSRNSIRTLVVPSYGKSYPDRTVVYKRAPRLRGTGVPLLMTEIAAPISLGLQPAGDRAPFIFLLVNKMLYKRRQTCISLIASFRFEGQFLAQKWH